MTTFTDAQQQALTAKDHHVLVAASAGSGKTTVLIARLMQKITSGIPVNRFLVVTFTNAAAAEMRERLERAIEERLHTTGDAAEQRFLQEQLLLLPTAHMSTIDAFALHLLEQHYDRVGLDPKFRLLSDTADRDLLREQVLNDTLNTYYDCDHPQNRAFQRLVANFGAPGKDGTLRQAILELSDFADARPDSAAWLAALPAAYQPITGDLTTLPIVRDVILPEISTLLAAYHGDVERLQKQANDYPDLAKTHAVLAALASYTSQLQASVAEPLPWDQLRTQLSAGERPQTENKSAKAVKNSPDPLAAQAFIARVKLLRDRVWGSSGEWRKVTEPYFQLTTAEWTHVQADAYKMMTTLVAVTEDFNTQFRAQKTRDNVLDFPDLGRLALKLLRDEANQEVVANIRAQFDELMIDEYQDINALQEELLSTLSSGNNMYMVGDVKQSIYGFRQAAPDLFMGKDAAFRQADNSHEVVDLAENFRSHAVVTSTVNAVCNQLMTAALGGVDYAKNAQLVPRAAYPAATTARAEWHVLLSDSTQKQTATDKRLAQYDWLVAKITALVQSGTIYDRRLNGGTERPVRFNDIAILTRSKTGYSDLVGALRAADIPVQVDGIGQYFKTMEVYLVLDVLRIIDNPHQDIPLVAVLRSPMVGCDENDLATIRRAQRQGDFWEALTTCAQTATPTGRKMQTFCAQLAAWQQTARQNDLVALVWQIYTTTHWLAYVTQLPGGSQREANLYALYDYAKTYQQRAFGGLARFIAYVEKLQANGGNLGEAPQEANPQALQLMTIHKSKGQEFPIVFLPELDKGFNISDKTGTVIVHQHAGVGLQYTPAGQPLTWPTLQKRVVQKAITNQSLSEELRLFYVAMTRAEQQLYFVSQLDVTDSGNEHYQAAGRYQPLVARAQSASQEVLPADLVMQATSYADWLLLANARTAQTAWQQLFARPLAASECELAFTDDFTITLHRPDAPAPAEPLPQPVSANGPQATALTVDDAAVTARLTYQYPDSVATRLPAYHAVSDVKRIFDDPDNVQLLQHEDLAKQPYHFQSEQLAEPAFMATQAQAVPANVRGSGLHLVLQMLPLDRRVTAASCQQQVAELVAAGRLEPSVAAVLPLDWVVRFFATPFGQLIQAHVTELRREATFAMTLAADQVYNEATTSDPILVHGIIDGYYVDHADRTITLFDYKTDHVATAAERDRLKERYAGQLALYCQALASEWPDYTVLPPRLIVLATGDVLVCHD